MLLDEALNFLKTRNDALLAGRASRRFLSGGELGQLVGELVREQGGEALFDIVETARMLPTLAGPGTYVGYSMGGRVALLAAANDADGVIERLVLIGATAGLATPSEREDRQRLDAERADHLLAVGLDVFLDEWLSAPLFATLPPDPAGLALRKRNDPAGLAHSLRHHGTGSQPSLWGQLDQVLVPTLVIAGARDAKFTDIGQRLVDELPNGQFVSIPDAGHAAHSERPEAVADVISQWRNDG